MIVSRKVTATGVAGVIATAAVWLADHYLAVQLDVQEVMLPLVGLAVAAGWITKEDARVLEHLKLKHHDRLTVGDLVTLHQVGKHAAEPAPGLDEPEPGTLAAELQPPRPAPVVGAWRDPATRTEAARREAAAVELTIPHGRLASEYARENDNQEVPAPWR